MSLRPEPIIKYRTSHCRRHSQLRYYYEAAIFGPAYPIKLIKSAIKVSPFRLQSDVSASLNNPGTTDSY